MSAVQPLITQKEMALVRKIARDVRTRFYPAGKTGAVSLDDLIHNGIVGLLEARARFDPGQGTPWLVFAAYRVRGEMMDQLRRAPMVRLPHAVQARVKQLRAAAAEIESSGRRATTRDLAAAMGCSEKAVGELAAVSPKIAPADRVTARGRDDGGPAPVTLASNDSNPELIALRRELAQLVDQCLKALTRAKDRLIVLARHIENLKLRELAEMLDCSIENVRLRQRKAEKELRKCLKRQGWNAQGLAEVLE